MNHCVSLTHMNVVMAMVVMVLDSTVVDGLSLLYVYSVVVQVVRALRCSVSFMETAVNMVCSAHL